MLGISNPMLGRIEALLSAVLMSFTFYFVKASPYSASQIGFIRGIINLAILYTQSVVMKIPLFGDWVKLEKCCSRGFLGMIANYLMMISNKLLSISVYSVLSRMNIFGIIFLDVIYLHHNFKWITLLMALTSVVGVTLVVAPSTVGLGSGEGGLEFRGTPQEYLGLLTACGFIGTNSMLRVFTSSISNDVGIVQSTFFFNAFLSVFCGFFLLWDPLELPPMQVKEAVCVALLTYVIQLLFMDANAREQDPSIIAIIQTSVILFSMTVDFFLFGTILSLPNIAGALLVMISTTVSMIKK